MTDESLSQGDTPAPDANAAPELELPEGGEPAPSTGTDDAPIDDPKAKDGFTKRIDELTRDFRTAQRERDAERFEREKLNRELESLRNQRPQSDEPAGKTLEDFGYDGEKFAAYLRKQAEQEATQAARTAAQQERSTRNWTQFQERATAYAKDSPGYTEAFQRLQGFFPPHIADGLIAAEEAPALVEFLGNNVAEAISLRNADPFTAGMMIGALQSRIKAERDKAKAAKKDPPPAPPPKLEGGEGSGVSVQADSPDSDNLSDAEWTRRRNAQLSRRK